MMSGEVMSGTNKRKSLILVSLTKYGINNQSVSSQKRIFLFTLLDVPIENIKLKKLK
jgi:hypothetical protein